MKSLRSPKAVAVAAVLKRVREDEGLTQRELAQRLEREHSIIAMYETDQRQVEVPEFISIADAMGRSPLELLAHVLAEVTGRDPVELLTQVLEELKRD